ncbi:beta-ketoacyl synthase N-terminal-like domain-containing protein [Streptomyces sp. NPDC048193]|uniref:beta-ketoacyl synthase N-terminal-like domain-containing protein n=1 Tax=unclassified Streptomyces TaxID=2593676 RepID=UPI0034260DDA
MDKREILTRFKDGTLERRHTLALLSAAPAPVPVPVPPAGKDAVPPAPAAAARPGPERPAPGPTPAPCAVIGVQARMPHTGDLAALWRTELTGESASHAADRDGPDRFDAAALGLTDTQAAFIGPGERLLLDTARRVLQSAGYAGVRLDGLHGPDGQRRCVGVFTALTGAGRPPDTGPHPGSTAPQDTGSAAARLSHLFDLRGPSRHVDTGPSSFLTALHLGLAALRAGECAAALVAAAGPGPGGTGAAAVLLKPLADARRCADAVHAVVLADAAAHPGRGPQPGLGERLRRRAVRAAGIPQAAVGLKETGQAAGAVGGAAAFLRALLQLKYATLLPSPGRPEPRAWRPAASADGAAPPRTALAGVYEPGAEHAVVVLQEPPPAAPAAPSADDAAAPGLVLLSAPTPAHLAAAAAQLADLLAAAGPAGGARPPGPAAVARELRLGRAAQPCRLALVADRTDRLADTLSAFAAGTTAHGVRTADLRAAPGDPLLLGELAETSAYLGALWQGRHFEQLTRLWLAGADVLATIPGDDGAPVLELPAAPPPHTTATDTAATAHTTGRAGTDTAATAGTAAAGAVRAAGERREGRP